MEPAKTVSIVCPENLRAGYKNIPTAEYDPAVHVLFDREAGTPGPAPSPALAEPPAIEIPDDWKSLHWKQRVALAEKLNGDAALEPTAGQTQTEAADAVIAAALAARSAA